MDINDYLNNNYTNTFKDFLDNILDKLKVDLKDYIYTSGFISFLDERKVNERIQIISANGRFLNKDNINIITSKEIDNLSIVYMTKKSQFKNNIYIDVIKKNHTDVFIYIEFDRILDTNQKNIINIFFKELNTIIKHKNWELK